jgi:hypothetical protein
VADVHGTGRRMQAVLLPRTAPLPPYTVWTPVYRNFRVCLCAQREREGGARRASA